MAILASRNREKKVLVTGFEPFGNHRVNPSEQLALALNGRYIHGYRITGEVLPVSFARAPEKLIELVQQEDWSAIVSVGVSEKAHQILMESLAINFNHSPHPDNDGSVRTFQPITEDGPTAYLNSLPFDFVKDTSGDNSEWECQISLSAGGFVCNHLFYSLMHHVQVHNLKIPSGFIHVPAWPKDHQAQHQDLSHQLHLKIEKILAKVLEAISLSEK
jgi:pyroglutamyl-peptidase